MCYEVFRRTAAYEKGEAAEGPGADGIWANGEDLFDCRLCGVLCYFKTIVFPGMGGGLCI